MPVGHKFNTPVDRVYPAARPAWRREPKRQGGCNDLTIVLTNFGTTAASWATGDFIGDGTVNINNLTIVLSNFGQSLSPLAARRWRCPNRQRWFWSLPRSWFSDYADTQGRRAAVRILPAGLP